MMSGRKGRFQGTDSSQGVPPGIYNLGDERIAAMDAAGIDVQILSHTAPGPEELDHRFHESCHNVGIHLAFSDSYIGRV